MATARRILRFIRVRPEIGSCCCRAPGSPTTISKSVGGAGYLPVAADYDGDGKADFVVYNSTSGLWFGLKSSTGFTTSLSGQLGRHRLSRDPRRLRRRRQDRSRHLPAVERELVRAALGERLHDVVEQELGRRGLHGRAEYLYP
jgi:hypothetical protein